MKNQLNTNCVEVCMCVDVECGCMASDNESERKWSSIKRKVALNSYFKRQAAWDSIYTINTLAYVSIWSYCYLTVNVEIKKIVNKNYKKLTLWPPAPKRWFHVFSQNPRWLCMRLSRLPANAASGPSSLTRCRWTWIEKTCRQSVGRNKKLIIYWKIKIEDIAYCHGGGIVK